MIYALGVVLQDADTWSHPYKSVHMYFPLNFLPPKEDIFAGFFGTEFEFLHFVHPGLTQTDSQKILPGKASLCLDSQGTRPVLS